MVAVSVGTTQNVEIEYRLANIGDRLIEGLVDLAVYFFYSLMMSLVILPHYLQDVSKDQKILIETIAFLPIAFYSLIFELVFNGQTLGKMAMGTRVIRLDGTQPTFANYMLRWMLRVADVWVTLGAVGLTAMAMSERCQRLGDMAAGTTVVKLAKKMNLEDVIFAEYDPNYTVRFPEVSRLTDKHISLIKEVILAHEAESNYQIIEAMSFKLQQVLGIDAGMSHLDFLEIILRDYAHSYYSADRAFA